MTNADEKLKELGFELVRDESYIGAWIYHNPGDDHLVEINDDVDDWFLHSVTISTNAGQHDPMGLTLTEIQAFIEKIEELKTTAVNKEENELKEKN
ncbi:MAG: hypothetical protein J6B01_04845 [Ruminococcus sp.]|nr:hypothetical protein [Ruminococcus sp.]MBO5319120.1 hypothetical protein [Ruminococcus sp.]